VCKQTNKQIREITPQGKLLLYNIKHKTCSIRRVQFVPFMKRKLQEKKIVTES